MSAKYNLRNVQTVKSERLNKTPSEASKTDALEEQFSERLELALWATKTAISDKGRGTALSSAPKTENIPPIIVRRRVCRAS